MSVAYVDDYILAAIESPMAPLSTAWDTLRFIPYMACSFRQRSRATLGEKTPFPFRN